MSDGTVKTGPTERSSAPDGLSAAEAAERLHRLGANVAAEMRPKRLTRFLGKFWGIVPWMLEAVVAVDLILGRWIEAAVVVALVLFNASIGYMQEGRAQRAIALLRQRLSIEARVRRDGHWQRLPAADLVPGDLVHVRAGDVVPADVRLTEGDIDVDQSQLSGESLAVNLRSASMAYAAALVRRGEATGVVDATGGRTYHGRTLELVRTAEAPRRLESLVVKIAGSLGAAVFALAIVAFITMAARGMGLAEMLPFGMMLLATSVPVALPMMFTMTAALGARGLADRGVLVTRLAAIEDAASMDVLCLDKTGTLTVNRLTVREIVPLEPNTSDDVLRLAAQASDEATQDPIDLAILTAARATSVSDQQAQRVNFVPFDPASRRSEATVRRGDQELRIVKGAVETIAGLAHVPESKTARDIDHLAAGGARVIAVGAGVGADLALAGFIALEDPLREDAAALVSELHRRGIRVVVVTGDGEATARHVAGKAGIPGDVAPAGVLQPGFSAASADRYGVFAGVFPEQKFLLVQALQNAGHTVGMTGDGINDAPALRQADVGIAVAGATDVAKAAASLVLTRPGLGEITMAVDASRRIFQRTRSFVLTMISMKLSTPVFLALGVIFLGAFVLAPLQIVLLMLLGNFVTMSVSMDQVDASPLPDRWAIAPLMTAGAGLAALALLFNLTLFWLATTAFRLDTGARQTYMFFWLLIGAGQALLYVTRNRGFFWERPFPGRLHLAITLAEVGALALLATQGWLMAPIPVSLLGGLLVLVLIFLVLADLLKIGLMRGARSPVRQPASFTAS